MSGPVSTGVQQITQTQGQGQCVGVYGEVNRRKSEHRKYDDDDCGPVSGQQVCI